jgi:hypothetical protein
MNYLRTVMDNQMFVVLSLLVTIPVALLIGAVAIWLLARHRERMALIDRGIHPDTAQPQSGWTGEER